MKLFKAAIHILDASQCYRSYVIESNIAKMTNAKQNNVGYVIHLIAVPI